MAVLTKQIEIRWKSCWFMEKKKEKKQKCLFWGMALVLSSNKNNSKWKVWLFFINIVNINVLFFRAIHFVDIYLNFSFIIQIIIQTTGHIFTTLDLTALDIRVPVCDQLTENFKRCDAFWKWLQTAGLPDRGNETEQDRIQTREGWSDGTQSPVDKTGCEMSEIAPRLTPHLLLPKASLPWPPIYTCRLHIHTTDE